LGAEKRDSMFAQTSLEFMMKDDPNLAEEYQDTIIGIKK
jgi:hypothetical protein